MSLLAFLFESNNSIVSFRPSECKGKSKRPWYPVSFEPSEY